MFPDSTFPESVSAEGMSRERRSAGHAWPGTFFATTVLILSAMLLASPLALSQKPSSSKSNTAAINTSANLTEELPPGPMQAKATTTCLECHEARIILQQRLSKAAWTKELDKMIKWGAVSQPEDRDGLIDYLSANFGPDKPPYEPARSAAPAMQKGSTAKRK